MTLGAGLGLVLSYFVLFGIWGLTENSEWARFLEKDVSLAILIIGISTAGFFTGAYIGTRWTRR